MSWNLPTQTLSILKHDQPIKTAKQSDKDLSFFTPDFSEKEPADCFRARTKAKKSHMKQKIQNEDAKVGEKDDEGDLLC